MTPLDQLSAEDLAAQRRLERLEKRMGFWEHIGELRKRLVISVLILLGCGVAAAFFIDPLMAIVTRPVHSFRPDLQLSNLGPTEGFFFFMRLCIMAAVVVAAPLILHQFWLFVAPALNREERARIAPLLPVVLLLFSGGVLFVYYLLLPPSLALLIGIGEQYFQTLWTSKEYFNFTFSLCLAGGFLFELPVVLALLGWLGLVTPGLLWRQSGAALVILMLAAAIITPTGDAFTMLLFTAPLMLLYFLSIGIVWLVQRPRKTVPA
jgi:sec-independent protein translocase protein TatC